jgi:glycosyltransferase involved in cell wall biosynthesis
VLRAADADPGREGISVVIPAFNEEAAIGGQLDEVDLALRQTGRPYEIVVVDDGSRDGTAQQAAARGVRLIQRDRNYGYGAALKAGIAEAKYDWILITDADGTYPSASIPELLEHIPEADMAVGARTGKTVHIPWVRRPAKWLLTLYASALAGQYIPDLNSGMRIMRKSIVESFAHLMPSGFSFTTTITLAMLCNGYRVAYVPIDYFHRLGTSKIRLADFFRFLWLITRLALRFRRGALIRIVGSAVLLLLLFRLLPAQRLLHALGGVRPGVVVAAVLLFVVVHLLGALKWHLMVNEAGAGLGFSSSVRAYFSGLVGSLFLPSVIGGDVVMVAAAWRETRRRAAIVTGSLLNRALDLGGLAILSVAGAVLLGGGLGAGHRKLLHMIAGLTVIGIALFVTSVLLLHPDRLPARLRAHYLKHRDAIDSLRHPRMYALPFALGLVLQFCLLLLHAWIGQGCGVHAGLSAWLLVWPLAKFLSFLPVTLGGIGAREAALAVLLVPFGVEPAAAVAAVLAGAGFRALGSLLGGLFSRLLPATAAVTSVRKAAS